MGSRQLAAQMPLQRRAGIRSLLSYDLIDAPLMRFTSNLRHPVEGNVSIFEHIFSAHFTEEIKNMPLLVFW